MFQRLVLGSSPHVDSVARRLSELPGTVRVATSDGGLVDSLHEAGINVSQFESLDDAAVRSVDHPDAVAVFEPTSGQTLDRCRTVQSVYPDAYLLAYSGTESVGHETALAQIADRVLDPARVTADHVVSRVGERGRRSRQLWEVLREIDRLAIVTHDNPDPDAIASGLALSGIAGAAGTESAVCYFGDITHQENRALVNVLNLELENIEDGATLEEYDGIALVDHSRPGVNDQLPAETPVDVVIDHHPPRSPIDARFVDLRSDVGATSTLLVDYLDQFNIDPGAEIATALLFGIHVDTDGFSREVCQQDFEAAAKLVSVVDFGTFERIEAPNVSPSTLETIARAISNRHVEKGILVSGVGELHERDALAQAADRLLNLEDITTTLVYGVKDGTIFVSARARGTDLDLGETLREAFDQIGSAGGHVDMAGAQIHLGVLEAVEGENESLYDIVDTVVRGRFLDVLDTRTTYQMERVYHTDATAASYLVDAPGALDQLTTDSTEEELDSDRQRPQDL